MTSLLVPAALVAVALAGCSSAREQKRKPDPSAPAHRQPRLKPAHCPPGLAGCRTASGRIVYVERVDPDGDGDAHFVLFSRESITLPGVSVIDVAKSRRPSPLPGVGDRMSAAGTTARGSHGQLQIEAIELHWARASR